jgi:hypothetical protein
MPVLQGNISGSITSVAYDIPSTIVSYYLTNMTGGALTVSLAVVPDGGPTVYTWTGSIAANSTERSDVPIKLLRGYQILIVTAGSIYYYISIE